jgi:uncharacterized delta-60 repeat protein
MFSKLFQKNKKYPITLLMVFFLLIATLILPEKAQGAACPSGQHAIGVSPLICICDSTNRAPVGGSCNVSAQSCPTDQHLTGTGPNAFCVCDGTNQLPGVTGCPSLRPATAAPGNLDTTFGPNHNGKVTTDLGGLDGIKALALQPDGKIIAAGGTSLILINSAQVVRYNSDGSLDNNFNGNGKLNVEGVDGFSAIAIQNDGKILLAGPKIVTVSNTPAQTKINFLLMRLTPEGSPDSSFGTNGQINTDVGGAAIPSSIAVYPPEDPNGNAGKIVVAGTTNKKGSNDFVMVRYSPTGTLDSTFTEQSISGTPGNIQVSVNIGIVTDMINGSDDKATAVAIDSEGKIVVVGSAKLPNTPDTTVAVARYDATGKLDPTFNPQGGGKFAIFGVLGGKANALAIQPDGNILIVGTGGDNSILMARFEKGGLLDPNFGSGGEIGIHFNQFPLGTSTSGNAVRIQPDGKILVGGIINFKDTNGDGVIDNKDQDNDFLLVRTDNRGKALDQTFATGGPEGGGAVTTDFDNGSTDQPLAMLLQPDGKIILGGASGKQGSPAGSDFALARYLNDAGGASPQVGGAAAPSPAGPGTGPVGGTSPGAGGGGGPVGGGAGAGGGGGGGGGGGAGGEQLQGAGGGCLNFMGEATNTQGIYGWYLMGASWVGMMARRLRKK